MAFVVNNPEEWFSAKRLHHLIRKTVISRALSLETETLGATASPLTVVNSAGCVVDGSIVEHVESSFVHSCEAARRADYRRALVGATVTSVS